MKKTRLLVFSCLWAFCTLPALAAEHPLPARHTEKKLNCNACHGTAEPTGNASQSACIDCHGDGPAMAEETRDRKPNPHAPPLADCTSCHRQHPPAK